MLLGHNDEYSADKVMKVIRDVIFLKNDFPKKGNIDISSHLYEMEEEHEAFPIEWEPVFTKEN